MIYVKFNILAIYVMRINMSISTQSLSRNGLIIRNWEQSLDQPEVNNK